MREVLDVVMKEVVEVVEDVKVIEGNAVISIASTTSTAWTSRASLRVFPRAEKMQRHVQLLAHHPTVMRVSRNVEEGSRKEVVHLPVGELHRRVTGKDEADVLDITPIRPDRRSDVHRPAPARLVDGPADRHTGQRDELEPALLEVPHFIGGVESLED
jgi:hypothetical protein